MLKGFLLSIFAYCCHVKYLIISDPKQRTIVRKIENRKYPFQFVLKDTYRTYMKYIKYMKMRFKMKE